MKNVNENQAKKCIFKELDEFKKDVKKALGEDTEVCFERDGLYLECNEEPLCTEETLAGMSKYYDVEISSIHVDYCGDVCVVICYKKENNSEKCEKENEVTPLIEKLRVESDELETKKQKTINEIAGSFSEYVDKKLFAFLKYKIGEEAKLKREYNLLFEFWEHRSGCSETHFYVAGWKWSNDLYPEFSAEQNYFNGFRLLDLHREVLSKCVKILDKRLRDAGFRTFIIQKTNNCGFEEGKVRIRW